ncbi:MAG: LPS export ABC transporter permease LptF [Gammaproteobacteria bacterium]
MIIDRYLIVEILQTLLAVMIVLLLIFMGRYFAVFLADAAAGEITSTVVLDLLLLRTISALNMMLPFALYIAVLVAFGRLYRDNEMTALAASGVGISRVVITVFGLGLLFAIIVAFISLWLSPWAEAQRATITVESEKISIVESVLPGQFNELGKRKDAVFYVEDIKDDRKTFDNIFVQVQLDESLDVFTAQSAYIYKDQETGDRYIVLVNGYRYRGIPGQQNFVIQEYQKNAIRIVAPKISTSSRRKRHISTPELLAGAKPRDQAELQWRFSMPLSTLLLAVLGVVLSRTSPRQGRFAKLFIAIMVYVIYNNLMSIARSWVEQSKVPVEVGIWWVHLLVFALFGLMYYQQVSGKRFWPKRA